MIEHWISLGFTANWIREIKNFINYKKGFFIPFIHDIHFAHFDANLIPSGRSPQRMTEKEVKYFLKICSINGLKTTLLLNSGDYDLFTVINILDSFYLPLGVRSVVISDKSLARKISSLYPELLIQGSCISYIDTIYGLLEEKSYGIELHNPATWTIRNMPFIKSVNESGYKQKLIPFEGCVRKCELEGWHRNEAVKGRYHDFDATCKRVVTSIYVFLMSSWVTIEQLRRMESYIDVLKLPRNTFDNFDEFYRFINLYETNEPYNILDFYGTFLSQIKKDNVIMSNVFDDSFFDNTISDKINQDFLMPYIKKLDRIPYFKKMDGMGV
ncbi:MAG: hypothetical protein FWG98_06215 [Candidatus Cloacimonetes bacterium]|nr:hypothetical protein [Candidatus Cloacimonadota bacterium]